MSEINIKNHKTPIITLLTDFGLKDEYVGVMKGVMLTGLPQAKVVDICHAVPAGDVRRAAMMLADVHACFPRGTIHVVVVDPGVGSRRRILGMRAAGHTFLSPDNGALALIRDVAENPEIRRVDRPDLYRHPVSRTFHGRDIFAPMAAKLAAGLPFASIGPVIPENDFVRLHLPGARITKRNMINGHVLYADRFGNLITNITENDLAAIRRAHPENIVIEIAGHFIHGIKTSYASGSPNELLVVIGSQNRLELAVNGGNAADTLNAGKDDEVCVFKKKP